MIFVKFVPRRDYWIGYVYCHDNIVFADIGDFEYVFEIINNKYDELLQRFEI